MPPTGWLASIVAPSKKLTLPVIVPAVPLLIVAVKVTLVFRVEGEPEVASVVVAEPTICVMAELVLVA